MKPDCIRTSLDSIAKVLADQTPQRPKQRLSLDVPIVLSRGKPLQLSHEEIYDLIDFP